MNTPSTSTRFVKIVGRSAVAGEIGRESVELAGWWHRDSKCRTFEMETMAGEDS